ncbi:MAG: NUDIX hydrolase [Acidimicrobiales bacterium]
MAEDPEGEPTQVPGGGEPRSGPALRAAATIMVVRDGVDDVAPLEVLMVRRNLASDFVGGAYVFPGGAVDPSDGGAEAERFCAGRSDTQASGILGVRSGGLAFWVAALRECFEEAGVLLAYNLGGEGAGAHPVPGPSRSMLSLAAPGDATRFANHRIEVNAGRERFLDVCREEELHLAVDQVHYFAHWITPEGAPRRYDTRFFVAAAPPDQVPAHDQGETIATEWLRPGDALARHRQGDIELIFPTIRNLQAIGRFTTTSDLLAAAAVAGRIPAMLPRVVADGPGIRILLPGDSGYDDAAVGHSSDGTGAAMGAGTSFNDVVRAISMAANREDPDPSTQDPTPGGPLPPQPLSEQE